MTIHSSLPTNNLSGASSIQNKNKQLKATADQFVVDTQRAFSRILGQLMENAQNIDQNNDSFLSPIPGDIPNLLGNPTMDILNNGIPTQFNRIPTRISQAAAHASTQYTNSSADLIQNTNKTNVESINSFLGGKLKGTGAVFVEAGKRYGVNPALLASISIHETGNGASRAAHERNNISGTMTSSGLKNYSSIEESIMDMARNIRENYINKGLHTIQDIGKKYAPIGADNDPTNLNQYWVNQVTNNFKKLSVASV